MILELYCLLELLRNGDRVSRVTARRVDDDVGESGIYWLKRVMSIGMGL